MRMNSALNIIVKTSGLWCVANTLHKSKNHPTTHLFNDKPKRQPIRNKLIQMLSGSKGHTLGSGQVREVQRTAPWQARRRRPPAVAAALAVAIDRARATRGACPAGLPAVAYGALETAG